MTDLLETRPVFTKGKILEIVAAHVHVRDVGELRELWGPFPPSDAKLIKALWDLQREGEIKFKTLRLGQDWAITSIRPSRGVVSSWVPSHDSKGRHRVGKDMTDPQFHYHIAQGGPIERSKVSAEDPRIAEVPMIETQTEPVTHGPKPAPDSDWLKYVNQIMPARVRPLLPLIAAGVNRPIKLQPELNLSSSRMTSLVTRAEQLGWLTRDEMLNDRGKKIGVKLTLTEEGARLAAEPIIDDGVKRRWHKRPEEYVDVPAGTSADTPTQYPETDTPVEYPAVDEVPVPTDVVPELAAGPTKWPRIIDIVKLEDYPLISDLMTKESRISAYEQAAALLEGFDADLALSLLDKIQLTPLEKEVIAFVASLR